MTPASNFSFLAAHDEQLVRFGRLAERYFPDDPNTCLLKLRQFTELLAQLTASRKSPFGSAHRDEILDYLNSYLNELADDEDRNKYLIAWVSFFFVSNGFKRSISFELKLKDPITRAIFNNRSTMFRDCPEYRLFGGCVAVGRKVSLLRHLEVFKPPPELEGL